MAKICFPHYKKGEFASLADALKFLEHETYSISRYALCEIVQYNICYRNHLRRHGVEDLIVRLIDEAPQLKEEKVLLHRLREWAAEEKLADYDIQCYNIKDKITIHGHTFNGLQDIREHIELFGREGYDGLHCWSPTEVEHTKMCILVISMRIIQYLIAMIWVMTVHIKTISSEIHLSLKVI